MIESTPTQSLEEYYEALNNDEVSLTEWPVGKNKDLNEDQKATLLKGMMLHEILHRKDATIGRSKPERTKTMANEELQQMAKSVERAKRQILAADDRSDKAREAYHDYLDKTPEDEISNKVKRTYEKDIERADKDKGKALEKYAKTETEVLSEYCEKYGVDFSDAKGSFEQETGIKFLTPAEISEDVELERPEEKQEEKKEDKKPKKQEQQKNSARPVPTAPAEKASESPAKAEDGPILVPDEARESAEARVKALAKEYGVAEDRIFVDWQDKYSCIRYNNGVDTPDPIEWFETDKADEFFQAGNDQYMTELRQKIQQTDKEAPEPPEGADARNPGKNLEKVLQQERAEDVKRMMEERDMEDRTPEKSDEAVTKEDNEKTAEPELTARQKKKLEIDSLKKEIDGLIGEVTKETSRMVVLGGSREAAENINGLSRDIGNKTIKLAKAQQEYRSMTAAAVLTAPGRAAKALGKSIVELGRQMVRNGKESIAKIADQVHLSNERALTRGRSAFVGLEHNVTQTYRNWKHANYSLEKMQVRAIDSLEKRLTKHYLKNAERTTALKNLGNNIKTIFSGKKHEHIENNGLTEKQTATLAKLEEMKLQINNDAEKYFADYNRSAEKDLERLTKNSIQRDTLEMKPHRTLQEDIDRIHDQMKKDSAKRSADKDRGIPDKAVNLKKDEAEHDDH